MIFRRWLQGCFWWGIFLVEEGRLGSHVWLKSKDDHVTRSLVTLPRRPLVGRCGVDVRCVCLTLLLHVKTECRAWLSSQVHPHMNMNMTHPTAVTPTVLPHPQLSAASPMLGSPVGTATSAAQNAPCSTLFVANLGPFCSEQELKDLFGRYYM